MGIKTRRRISDNALTRLRQVFRDAEDELNALGNSGVEGEGMGEGEPDGDEGDDNHTHIHIHAGGEGAAPADAGAPAGDDPVEARFQTIEQTLQQIIELLNGGGQGGEEPLPQAEEDGPPVNADGQDGSDLPDGPGGADDGGDLDGGTEGENTRDRAHTGDSAALSTTFAEVVADAEILVPGFRMPTFDAARKRATTVDTMCQLRKGVLDHMASTQAGMATISTVLPTGRTLDKLSCGEAAVVFKAAASAQRIINNRQSTGDSGRLTNPSSTVQKPGVPRTLAELNAFHQQHYAAAGKKK